MNKKEVRIYDNSSRAENARQTEALILKAAVDLWMQKSLNELTLDAVAKESGVTIRTIIRKYGNKEGLFLAVVKNQSGNFLLKRNEVPPKNWKHALQLLLSEYHEMGDAVIRTLNIEDFFPATRVLLNEGRKYHLNWCKKVFEDFLPNPKSKNYKIKLLALRTATDIYAWKILYRDLKCSRKETGAIMEEMVSGILKN